MIGSNKQAWSGASSKKEQTIWAGYASLAWVVVFIAFHVYWAYGGRFGLGDAPALIPPFPQNVAGWLFFLVVIAMFLGGILVPLAMVHAWGYKLPRWVVLSTCWIGSITLMVRACASFVDDFTRTTGLLQNGITGMTYAQTTGASQITANTLWSGRAIDAYFLLGGILYGLAAWYYHKQKHGNPGSQRRKTRT